jgi:hypothetical protein
MTSLKVKSTIVRESSKTLLLAHQPIGPLNDGSSTFDWAEAVVTNCGSSNQMLVQLFRNQLESARQRLC